MTITVIRRALWLVAAIALGVATVAYWEWRPLGLVIAAGAFVILIPIDMVLAREERENREAARAGTPFGPLQRYATRTYRTEGPFWEIELDVTRRVNDDHGQSVRAPRIPWWRRMYRRITAPWWIAAWMPLLLIPAGLWLAPIVHADPLEDIAYISVLDDHGIYYSSEQAAIDTAHAMCDAFDVGASFRQVLHTAVLAGMRQMDAANEIGAAIGIYCGEHSDVLRPPTVRA